MASPLVLGGAPSESFSHNPSPTQVRRKPVPQDVDLTSGPVHPSSPLSIEGDKPTLIPTAPVARPPSPSSADGDPFISVQKNPNRYATSPTPVLGPRTSTVPPFPSDYLSIEHDMASTCYSASPTTGRLIACPCPSDIPDEPLRNPYKSIPLPPDLAPLHY
jgi:hypothetical protein